MTHSKLRRIVDTGAPSRYIQRDITGEDGWTARQSRRSDGDPQLKDDDIFFVDLGVVWDQHEGDAGATFVVGNDAQMKACADAAKTVFDEVERRAWVREHADNIRQALMFEPRGHADMYGGYLTPPVSPTADFGIIFLHNEGYSDHCGHGVIALATAAVELGWVQRESPETRVGIDAPCGFIEAFVKWDGMHANGVRFINVPSFIYRRDVSVETPTYGTVTGDIAFGGAFYFYTDGAPHGLAIRESSVDALKQFGAEVKIAANRAFPLVHPEIPEINHIYGTIIHGAPRFPGSTQANCCIFADREVDRSPTGSGTAGRVAQLCMDSWCVERGSHR
jgi:proline racemase